MSSLQDLLKDKVSTKCLTKKSKFKLSCRDLEIRTRRDIKINGLLSQLHHFLNFSGARIHTKAEVSTETYVHSRDGETNCPICLTRETSW